MITLVRIALPAPPFLLSQENVSGTVPVTSGVLYFTHSRETSLLITSPVMGVVTFVSGTSNDLRFIHQREGVVGVQHVRSKELHL